MAWERRKWGDSYYYRSVRDGEKVRKEYVGRGEVAEALACADRAIRRQKELRRWKNREELKRVTDLAAPILETDEAVSVLARAVLVAAGYRRHNGEWRMKRGA